MTTGQEDHENVEDRRTSDANPREDPHACNASVSAAKQTPTPPRSGISSKPLPDATWGAAPTPRPPGVSGISTKPPPDATALSQQFPSDEEVPETTLGTEGPPTPGQILFDKYEVIRELGGGGMGKVLLVRNSELDVERALKLIKTGSASNHEFMVRFQREARAMARLDHPHIVKVYTARISPVDNEAYIEMEYVRGQSLAALVTPDRPMPLDWTVQFVEQLCDALQLVHEHGIVHRDLKPSNLMLLDGQPPGQVSLKMLDFGLAKTRDDLAITRPGFQPGTYLYMSPEQLSGVETLDARSDIYSVGIILFEVLTGRRPFHFDRVTAPRFAEKNPDVRVPLKVEQVVLRCLERDPDLRPQSALELAEEFRRAAAVVPPGERPLSWLAKSVSWVTISATLLAALVSVAWPYLPYFRPKPAQIESSNHDGATPSTPRLSATPSTLKLRAGSPKTILISIAHDRGWKPNVTPIDRDDGIIVETEPEASSEDLLSFRVSADLNRETSSKPSPLIFHGSATRGGKTISAPAPLKVDVTVEPPDATLPPDCQVAPGAKFERISGKIVADRIERVFSDDPEMRVVFLLIKWDRLDDPKPFYIMENKVWNGLFARFAAERPEAVKDSKWKSSLRGSPTAPENAWLPVMNVTAKEAQEFATWLGGRLPSCAQWDKAAGVYDRGGRMGPFEGAWKPGQKDPRIAVGRTDEEGPEAVNRRANRDVSPSHCRDMASNGLEWTRDEKWESRIFRGRRFTKDSPLMFKDLDEERIEVAPVTYSDREAGFRVVLEPDL
jgi:serine/threonine protein kinase